MAPGGGTPVVMKEEVPVFVVVGNVNQGKSSVVATLTEDESVPISPWPGTTVRTGDYAFRTGERILFRLIDTPGFQQARRVLAILAERSKSAADRRAAVERFVAENRESGAFPDEVRLLEPIVGGAGILYVVDASSRFQPSNEAEMEILRWTGRPAMALLNRTRDRDYAEEWRPVLEQFFNVVREFDAHRAGYRDRRDLLRSFREVRDDWRPILDEAIAALEREWESRRHRAAHAIAELMVRALSHVERKRVTVESDPVDLKKKVEESFRESLRKFESAGRAEVERLYRHRRTKREEEEIRLHDADLFSEESWRLFGLTRGQLVQYGVVWGTLIGSAIDLMVGGLSFFAGAAIGAVAGGLGGFLTGTKVSRTWSERSRLARVLFPGETGRYLGAGPVTNPAFAWMLLDRALVHYAAVRDRSHARQDPLRLAPGDGGGKAGVVADLPADLRGRIDGLFRKILKGALKGRVSPDLTDRLATEVEAALTRAGASRAGP